MNEAKHIALLCPGPSLDLFPGNGAGPYDAVIGVNRAAAFAPCDYWVVCDDVTFDLCRPLGDPVLVCDEDCHARLLRQHRRRAALMPWLDREHPWPPRKGSVRWWRFSATSALIVAWRLGAERIDCYGVDWAGTADWDGHTHESMCRTPSRWQDEQTIWAATVAALETQNIDVIRQQELATAP